jgi:hypothetical protein
MHIIYDHCLCTVRCMSVHMYTYTDLFVYVRACKCYDIYDSVNGYNGTYDSYSNTVIWMLAM